MPLTIRPLEPKDETEWRRLWTAYLVFYETKVDETVYQTTFQRLCAGDANEFSGLIALRDGGGVGLTHFLAHRHCWRIENVIYLQDLFVDPSERGQGTGRALIEAVYAIADENGTPNVFWLTHQDNVTARRLYDTLARKTDFVRYVRPT